MSYPPSAPQQPGHAPQPSGQQQAQQQPSAPQYPQAPAAPYQPQVVPLAQSTTVGQTTIGQTNTYAFVAIIAAFVFPLCGIIFGHLSLSQIKRTGDAGRGLALTGLIFGYAYVAFIVLFMIFYVSMIGLIIASAGAAMNDFGSYDYYDSL